jgi:hypothetical protein
MNALVYLSNFENPLLASNIMQAEYHEDANDRHDAAEPQIWL